MAPRGGRTRGVPTPCSWPNAKCKLCVVSYQDLQSNSFSRLSPRPASTCPCMDCHGTFDVRHCPHERNPRRAVLRFRPRSFSLVNHYNVGDFGPRPSPAAPLARCAARPLRPSPAAPLARCPPRLLRPPPAPPPAAPLARSPLPPLSSTRTACLRARQAFSTGVKPRPSSPVLLAQGGAPGAFLTRVVTSRPPECVPSVRTAAFCSHTAKLLSLSRSSSPCSVSSRRRPAGRVAAPRQRPR